MLFLLYLNRILNGRKLKTSPFFIVELFHKNGCLRIFIIVKLFKNNFLCFLWKANLNKIYFFPLILSRNSEKEG